MIGNKMARSITLRRTGGTVALLLIASLAKAGSNPDTLILTSTNETSNSVAVFKLTTSGTPSLSLMSMLPTGGDGGSPGGGGGALQFSHGTGAVANYGSNTVTRLARYGNSILPVGSVNLAANCVQPISVALTASHLFVVGSTCAESHPWPFGAPDGVLPLPDSSAGQIAAGQTWAAVTLKSGSVLQLPLNHAGALKGTGTDITLPENANNTPLGAAFWGDLLAFNPAHSADSFALLNSQGTVIPVAGPQPVYPVNAPCWLAKGPGNVWYSGNSPGDAISIFFSDSHGGVFYKSVPLPGSPTDVAVSADEQWLAVIYTAADGGHIAVFSIDSFGDLTPLATSSAIGVSAFDGVAFSQ
jgi:hypothetical protein